MHFKFVAGFRTDVSIICLVAVKELTLATLSFLWKFMLIENCTKTLESVWSLHLHLLMIATLPVAACMWLHSCSYLSKPTNIFPYGENTAVMYILSTSHHHVITRI